MSEVRVEPWGRIFYNAELDEFEAQVADADSQILLDRPISAGCLVTGQCNFSCAFCYGNEEALPATELSPDDWAKAFRRLADMGLMRVDISGGEPTIRCDLGSILTSALDAGLNVVLSTNGAVLGSRGPQNIPKAVRIHVSLDSGTAEIHESSRLRHDMRPSSGSFEKTSFFVLRAIDLGYKVRVLTCVGAENSQHLFELGEYIATLGVEEWNISRILEAGRAQNNYDQRWYCRREELLQQVHDLRKAFSWMRIRYSDRTNQNGYFLLVLPDGKLATQYTGKRDKVIVGNVFTSSLADLQKSDDFNLAEHCVKWLSVVSTRPFSIVS